ncbi:MAG TPA: nucleotidyltransferase domain-containing protein [Caldilineaceae bacterium]|nr:nucleotidyltransferase domain-containing protein [Caldilineaceae bacterium]
MEPATINLTDEEQMARYVAIWQRRMAAQQAQSIRLAEQVRSEASQIAAMLRSRFGVTRVILFGSLRRGSFAYGSDIDLAVAGLARQDFFAAVAEANALAHTWVDIKPLEDLKPHFRQRVLETGEDLA